MDDSPEHLEPGFDANKLTIPKLRSLLLEYGVDYSASYKKAQLVELFDAHIAPKAAKIRAARKRTKPSTRGITDVPSSQASTVHDDEADRTMKPPKSPTRRKSQRAVSDIGEATNDDELTSPRKRRPRSRKSISGADDETAETRPRSAKGTVDKSDQSPETDANAHGVPARRRSRKSAATPVIKHEISDPVAWHRRDDDSPFTSENPFQSGSSPPEAAAQPSRERRRRTTGPSAGQERQKSGDRRRRTTNYGTQALGAETTSKTYELSVASLRQDEVEAGEEFTPEEQFALIREQERTGQLVRTRRDAQPSKVGGAAKTGVGFVFLALLSGFGTLWTREKFQVGYCGVGEEPSTELGGVVIPEWAKILQPQCEPCPPHAICSANLQTSCEPDFILRPHPLSLAGILPLPLPPTCEPDGEKARRVKSVADKAVDELRKRKSAAECGELLEGKPVPSAEMKEEELKEKVSSQRHTKMSQQEFDALWESAIGDLPSRDEIVVGNDGAGEHRTFASTSLARASWSCSVRRTIREALVRHLGKLVAMALVLLSGGYARFSIKSGRETEARAKQLASYAMERLNNQAAWHAHDPQAFPEAYIGMGHLRDDVLRDEFSATRRVKLWDKVQKKVEQNSNVRPMNREGRSGDYGRVWEWIGPIAALEDGDGGSGNSNRRRSSRYSLPMSSYDSALNSSPLVAAENSRSEMSQLKSWDEGRPIY